MFIKLKFIFSLALTVNLLSCSFIDLRGLEITVFPAEADAVLRDNETVKLSFSPAIREKIFEETFKLSGVSGEMDGDFEWINNDMDSSQTVCFYPLEKLQPGFQYRLKINGELTARDGRTFFKKINIPFYYLTDADPPVIEAVSLKPAEITDIYASLKLTFSKGIDKDSFNDGFRLSPASDWVSEWNTDGSRVVITPEEQWLNLQYYRWTLSTDIISTDGIPLPEEYEGSFLVQNDTAAPKLSSLYPAADNKDGSFTLKTLLSADDLLIKEHLALNFSKAVDLDSLRKNLLFNPSIEGYLTAVSANTILYYIHEEIPPGNTYELTITEGLEDNNGNSTAADITRVFTPAVPVQEITSVVIEDQNGVFLALTETDFNSQSFIDTTGIKYFGTDGVHIIVNISEGYPESSINARLSFEQSISFTPVFPPGTLPPSLSMKNWDSDNSLRLIYRELTVCSTEEPVYYELRIKAGSSDSATPYGSYLTESVFFRMLAEVD